MFKRILEKGGGDLSDKSPPSIYAGGEVISSNEYRVNHQSWNETKTSLLFRRYRRFRSPVSFSGIGK